MIKLAACSVQRKPESAGGFYGFRASIGCLLPQKRGKLSARAVTERNALQRWASPQASQVFTISARSRRQNQPSVAASTKLMPKTRAIPRVGPQAKGASINVILIPLCRQADPSLGWAQRACHDPDQVGIFFVGLGPVLCLIGNQCALSVVICLPSSISLTRP